MTRQTYPMALGSSLVRSIAVAAIAGAALIASPLNSAFADGPVLAQNTQAPTTQTHKPPAAAAATSQRPDTVEQRITELHADLKIMPEQESKWNSVAQAMRENASNMEKLVADKRVKAPQSMTAVDDLTTYREFAQAHVDGLKNLISAFSSLYDSMPDAQKKNADRVFQDFGREG